MQDGSNQSRKRKAVEGDSGSGNRPSKQAARRSGRSGRAGDMQQNASYDLNRMPNFANLPPLPPGPLPFDPSDPTAFFALAAAFGANLPGMPPMSFPNAQGNRSSQKGTKQLCSDYHEKGFCALGNFCPFEHSDAAVAVPAHEVPEYDPEKSFLAVQPHRNTRKQASSHSQRRTIKASKSRAPFSQLGPSYDPSNTTLVVEHIPPESFSEDSVRNYFSEFGSIVEVDMHTNRRLAIIKFVDHSAASRAYSSPKAVFENRFVKVYWYCEEDHPEEEKLDLEAIAIKQAEAQKAFEERRRKEEEAAARAAEIERQLKEKNEEMQEIRRQLAELSGDKADEFSETLETLQAEAAELFDQHAPDHSAMRGRGRGAFRGAYPGRGFAPFPPRGRGFTSYRGAYRGRESGFYPAAFPGRSGVKRLDNRPRRLAVSGIEADTPRDEALRQYLLVSGTWGGLYFFWLTTMTEHSRLHEY